MNQASLGGRLTAAPAAAPPRAVAAARSPATAAAAAARPHKRPRTSRPPAERLVARAAAPLAPPADPPAADAPRRRLAVFVSGGGSNLRALHAATLDGRCPADVAVVITNAPSCGGAEFARAHGVPVLVHPPPAADPSAGLDAAALTAALTAAASPTRVDAVVLAGFLKLVPPALVRAFPRAVLNIHPGLLPAFGGRGFYGRRVHAAVLASGARFSGPTVHFVDEAYDTGPILAQAAVPVLPGDSPETLAARVLREEHRLLPECVAALVEERVTWRADGIPMIWTAR